MRRALSRVGVCALIGAVINLAVALALMFRMPPQPLGNRLVGTFIIKNDELVSFVIHRPGECRVETRVNAAVGSLLAEEVDRESLPNFVKSRELDWLRSQLSTKRALASGPAGPVCIEHAHGWPLLCFVGHGFGEANVVWMEMNQAVEITIPRSWSTSTKRLIVFGPVWLNLIANTLFYALMVGAIWLVCAQARWRSRMRSGLCPNCRYDVRGNVRGHERCPECGAELSRNPNPSSASSASLR